MFYFLSAVITIGCFVATNYRYENYGLGDIWVWLFLLGGIVNLLLIVANIFQKLNHRQLKQHKRLLEEHKKYVSQ